MERKKPLRADLKKTADWRRRSAEKAAENAKKVGLGRKPVKEAAEVVRQVRSKANPRRVGPPSHVRAAGSRASSAKAARDAGLDPDAPRNKYGQRCVEKVCETCGANFLSPPSGAGKRKTCSHRCAAELKKGRSKNAGRKNAMYKHGRATDRDSTRRKTFDSNQATCQAPGCERDRTKIHQHHVVTVQELRKIGGDRHDGRNALALCTKCHFRHHQRHTVVPLIALRDENFAFAQEVLGNGRAYEYLRRFYAGEDPRLDRIINGEGAKT